MKIARDLYINRLIAGRESGIVTIGVLDFLLNPESLDY